MRITIELEVLGKRGDTLFLRTTQGLTQVHLGRILKMAAPLTVDFDGQDAAEIAKCDLGAPITNDDIDDVDDIGIGAAYSMADVDPGDGFNDPWSELADPEPDPEPEPEPDREVPPVREMKTGQCYADRDGNIMTVRVGKSGFPYGMRYDRTIGTLVYTPRILETAVRKATEQEIAAYGLETGICLICSKRLTNPESVRLRIGPICREKHFGQ